MSKTQIKFINDTKAPKAIGPYSQGASSHGFFFFSGQLGLIPETGELPSGIQAQTDQVLKNIQALLEGTGLASHQVIKATIYLTTMEHFQTVNAAYEKFFKPPYPARTTIAVKELPKQALVEIEVIASNE